MENPVYTVIVEGDFLKCIDTSSGAIVGSINVIGKVLSGPMVTGDRCTVVFNSYMGNQGKVYKLPYFNVVTGFSA